MSVKRSIYRCNIGTSPPTPLGERGGKNIETQYFSDKANLTSSPAFLQRKREELFAPLLLVRKVGGEVNQDS
jgi:hypothetical protein